MSDDPSARVVAALDELGVTADRMPCDPGFADTAAFCARYGVAPEDSANTILVASRRDPSAVCACVLLATTRLDVNHTVRDLLGAGKVSFAGPEQTRELSGMTIGGVTPFGLPTGIPVYVDSAVLGRPSVVVGGGSRSLKLRIDPHDLLRVPGALAVDGLAAPAAAPGG